MSYDLGTDNCLLYAESNSAETRKPLLYCYGLNPDSRKKSDFYLSNILNNRKGPIEELTNGNIEALVFRKDNNVPTSCKVDYIAKHGEIVFTRENLLEYQKSLKITLQIKRRDGNGYKYVSLEDLKKEEIIEQLDLKDLINVIAALEEMLIIRDKSPHEVKEEDIKYYPYYHRIAISCTCAKLHHCCTEERNGGFETVRVKLSDEMEERDFSIYPPLINLQSDALERTFKMMGLKYNRKEVKNKPTNGKLYSGIYDKNVGGIVGYYTYDCTIEEFLRAYQEKTYEILRLQLEHLKANGKKVMTIQAPVAFLGPFEHDDALKDFILSSYAEASRRLIRENQDFAFIVIADEKRQEIIKKGFRNVITNVSARNPRLKYDSMEFDKNPEIREKLEEILGAGGVEEHIMVNSMPHDVAQVGNQGFSDGGRRAADERLIRTMVFGIATSSLSRNEDLQRKIGESKEISKIAERKLIELLDMFKKFHEEQKRIYNEIASSSSSSQAVTGLEYNSNKYKKKVQEIEDKREKLERLKEGFDTRVDDFNTRVDCGNLFANVMDDNLMTNGKNQEISCLATRRNVSLFDHPDFRLATTKPILPIKYDTDRCRGETKKYVGFGAAIIKQDDCLLFTLNSGDSFLKDKFDDLKGPNTEISQIVKGGLKFEYPSDISEQDKLELTNYFTAMAKSDPYIAMRYMLDKGCILKDDYGREIERDKRERLMTYFANFTEQKKLMDKLEKQLNEMKKPIKDRKDVEKFVLISVLKACLANEAFFKSIICVMGAQTISINVFANFFLNKIKKDKIDFLNDKVIEIDENYTIKSGELDSAKEYFSKEIREESEIFSLKDKVDKTDRNCAYEYRKSPLASRYSNRRNTRHSFKVPPAVRVVGGGRDL